MRCRFVEDPQIIIGLFTHGLITHFQNEVLKSCLSEVDEAYRIVEHMERPGDDAPATTTATTTTQTTTAPFSRSAKTTTSSQPRPSRETSRTTLTTSMGSAPPPWAVTTDSSLRSTAVAPPPITCFKCQGKGHRASQCPSSNLRIGLEDDAREYTRGDDVLSDDVYIADDGLEEDCLDPEVIGYIQITSAASPHPPSPHGTPRIYGSQYCRADPQHQHPCVPATPGHSHRGTTPIHEDAHPSRGCMRALIIFSRPGGSHNTYPRSGSRLRTSHIDLLHLREDQWASVQVDCRQW